MKELSTPNAAQEGNQRRGSLIPMRYMIGIVCVLAILVLGIVTPDILQYRAQLAERNSMSGLCLDSKIQISLTNSAGKGVNTNLTVVLDGSNTNVSLTLSGATGSEIIARVLLSNPNATSTATNAPSPAGFSPAPMPATTTPFEPYARLVTLLLSIISVLGLFFAYFVRKSLHETEEALEKRFDRNMDLWKEEQKTVAVQAAQVTSDAKEISLKLEEVKKLSQQLKEVTDELDRAEKKTSQKSAGKAEVAQASNALDAQMQEPLPAVETPNQPANNP
jgi:hypothetical protein